MSEPVIEIGGLRKVYRIYHGHGRGWLKSILMPWLPVERYAQETEALRGVDLQVMRGEVVGVLGRNGSGKSTLLRVIAGMTPYTAGEVSVRGHVRCVMATGIGFHARLSGRENVVYGSIAMGIPRRVALARMDAIVGFADLHADIDKPAMYYSRGMRARLALAVALQEAPGLLILDEALAAGDAGFTERCRARIDEICSSGSTVIVATHSLSLVKRACTRAIVLDEGALVADAAPAEAVDAYLALLGQGPPPQPERVVDEGAVELVDAYLCGDDGRPRERFEHGERLELHAVLGVHKPIEQPRLVVELLSADAGVRVTQLGTHYLDAVTRELATLRPQRLEGRYELVVAWPESPLGSGDFFWRLSLFPWVQEDDATVVCHFRAAPVCPFTSVAFPERSWRRRTLIEVASEVALSPVPQAQLREAQE